jgi:hypothetical protein
VPIATARKDWGMSKFGVSSSVANLKRVAVRPPTRDADYQAAHWLGAPEQLDLDALQATMQLSLNYFGNLVAKSMSFQKRQAKPMLALFTTQHSQHQLALSSCKAQKKLALKNQRC